MDERQREEKKMWFFFAADCDKKRYNYTRTHTLNWSIEIKTREIIDLAL